jgi:hypothetical protein
LARECENLEARVEDEAIRRTYGELAAHWRKLAAQEECGDEEKRPEFKTPYRPLTTGQVR